VSAVVRDLLDDGVVEELGLSTAGGVGKPATLLDVAADGRRSAMSSSCPTVRSARAASGAAWRPRCRRRCWRMEAAAAGDGAAVLARAGEHLGIALATVLSALDVTDVVLSGSGAVTDEPFRTAATRAIAARTMPLLTDRLVVRPGTFRFDDVHVGAAATVLDHELGIR
jgi:predicted NBD/HSP70 family sugar kinase